jgi:hypothetical protein
MRCRLRNQPGDIDRRAGAARKLSDPMPSRSTETLFRLAIDLDGAAQEIDDPNVRQITAKT